MPNAWYLHKLCSYHLLLRHATLCSGLLGYDLMTIGKYFLCRSSCGFLRRAVVKCRCFSEELTAPIFEGRNCLKWMPKRWEKNSVSYIGRCGVLSQSPLWQVGRGHAIIPSHWQLRFPMTAHFRVNSDVSGELVASIFRGCKLYLDCIRPEDGNSLYGTWMTMYQSTWHHIVEELSPHWCPCENVQPHRSSCVLQSVAHSSKMCFGDSFELKSQ
jgi:hypothetical protein